MRAWNPVPKYELADAGAIQALLRGEADAGQQKRALEWIINAAAGTYEVSYVPDSDQTIFAEGRRFVGLQIVKLMKLNLNTMSRIENARRSND